MSLGSVSRVLPIPGLSDYGLGFKSLADAIDLRNRTILHLETAEAMEDPEERKEFLTFIFVGAGYAGLEGIAELQDYVADMLDQYPRCRMDGTRWILVEALDRVMPEIPASLARFATQELRGRGIEILTSTRLDEVGERSARLSTGEEVPTRFVCWTAGVKPPAVVRKLGLPLTEHGRIEADETAKVPGHENVWAIGDVAAVPDPANKGKPSPPTAQHVIRQGRVVGRQRCGHAVGGQAAQVPLPHARRVRGHGPAQGRGHDAGHPPPRLPGLVRGPHLPRGGHARELAAAADRRRLDGRPALRPGLGPAGQPRTPHLAGRVQRGQPARGRAAWRTARRGLNAVPAVDGLTFRPGRAADLRPTFELSRLSLHGIAQSLGVDSGPAPEGEELDREWARRRPLVEFAFAQEGTSVIGEMDGRLVGFARTCRFGDMEELTELHVLPEPHGAGDRPGAARPVLARVTRPRRWVAWGWRPASRAC